MENKDKVLLDFMNEVIILIRENARSGKITIDQVHDMMEVIHNIPGHIGDPDWDNHQFMDEIRWFDDKHGNPFRNTLSVLYEICKKEAIGNNQNEGGKE